MQVWLGTIKKHTSGKDPEPSDAPASPTTVCNCHMVLAQILDLAVQDRMLPSNPARGVKLPTKNPGVKVYLTATQLETLVDECGDMGDLIALLGTSGLRYGEATALRVGDVDFLRRRVRVERNVRHTSDGPVYGTPKTASVARWRSPPGWRACWRSAHAANPRRICCGRRAMADHYDHSAILHSLRMR